MASAGWAARFHGGRPELRDTPQLSIDITGSFTGTSVFGVPPVVATVVKPDADQVELSAGSSVATRLPRYGTDAFSQATVTISLLGVNPTREPPVSRR